MISDLIQVVEPQVQQAFNLAKANPTRQAKTPLQGVEGTLHVELYESRAGNGFRVVAVIPFGKEARSPKVVRVANFGFDTKSEQGWLQAVAPLAESIRQSLKGIVTPTVSVETRAKIFQNFWPGVERALDNRDIDACRYIFESFDSTNEEENKLMEQAISFFP